nr:hypothetical protein [Tanacetum cinerariifolium]
NSFDCPTDSYHPPHPTYETYSGDACGNDSQIGYDCPPQFSLNYEPEPIYIQNYNSYPHDSPSFPQQYPCCEDCGVTHEPYQCQPKNHDYYHEQNSCYDSNSIGFDQSQPQQYTVNHPIFSAHHDLLSSQKQLNITLTKLPICYDDDDNEESSNSLEDNIISELPSYSAVTPSEPIDSLSMGDEHLNTILTTESDEFVKSSVENLVPNPSESEGENGCDVLACFTTFSNVLFDDDYDSDSSDDYESYHFDIPSPYRPPAKPPDGITGTLNIKMLGDVYDKKVPIPGLTITCILNQEKSHDLLSHLGFEAFQPSAECPMIINGKNIPLLDVPLFHFTPLINSSMGN